MKPVYFALCLATSLTPLLPLPAAAFDPAHMSAPEQAALNEAIKTYILENPEILVEAMGVLEDRRIAAQAQNDTILVQANAKEIFANPHAWTGGNPDGDVTVVEFIDYRCTYCRKAFPETESLVASDGKIRLSLIEFPILGEESELASRFALAARQLGGDAAYKKVHDALYNARGRFTLETLKPIAEQAGLDANAVIAAMNSAEISDILRANRQLAESLRINGTPAFILGGKAARDGQGAPEMLRGYAPADIMAEKIAAQRG